MNAASQTSAESPQPPLLSLAWAHFLNDGVSNYLPGILPVLLVSLNLSLSYAGLLMAALLVGQGMQPLVGLVADKLGGRAFIFAGLVGTAIGSAAVGFVPNAWGLIIALVWIGLCNSLFHPQAMVGVRGLGRRRAGFFMAIFLVGGEVGRGVWPVVASWVVTMQGLSSIWLMSIPAILTIPLLLRWAPTIPARHRDTPRMRLGNHARPLSLLLGFCILRSIMIYGVVTFVPLLWHEHGGSLTTGASFITIIMLVGIIGNLAGGWLGDHIGRRAVITVGIAAATLCLAGYLESAGLMAWVLLGLLGIFVFASAPLTVLIAQDILPKNRSLASGLALGFSNALGALCAIALGPIAQHWNVETALWVAVACGIAAIPLALSQPRHRPDAAAATT